MNKLLDRVKREAYKQGFIDAAKHWSAPECFNDKQSSIDVFISHVIDLANWNAEQYVTGKIRPFYVQQVGRAKRKPPTVTTCGACFSVFDHEVHGDICPNCKGDQL